MVQCEYENIIAAVHRFGWTESRVSRSDKFDRVWYRWLIWEPPCADNPDKKLQVQLQMWDNRKYPDGGIRFVVGIRGRPAGADIGSVEFESYGITDVVMIEPNVIRLVKAWRAVQEVAA